MKPIYPWLLVVFPILHLYSENLGAVRDEEIFPAVLAGLATTTLIFFAFRALTKSPDKSALITAILLLFFFSGGHFMILIDAWNLTYPARLLLLTMAIAVGMLILTVWRLPASLNFRPLAKSFYIASLALLIFPTATIIDHWLEADELVSIEKPRRYKQVLDTPEHPDIYYIIADGYPSNRHLLRDYGYDNTPFTEALEALGFFVAYDSKSNYGATLHSLSSSLNMRYVPENTANADVDGRLYLRTLIADNEVARVLIESGYTYVYMLSGFLRSSRTADFNLDFFEGGAKKYDFRTRDLITDGRSYKEPFYPLLLSSTLLHLTSGKLEPLLEAKGRPYTWRDTGRFFATLESLKRVPDMPEATFTFTHLLEPHGPVQLKRNGEKLAEATWRPSPAQFFAELELINEHLLEALRVILKRSTTPPIIILQADHGTDLGRSWSDDRHVTYFEILNAFHLPGGRPGRMRRDISPINTFRVILSAYYGMQYEELEVKHFDLPKGYDAPFMQIDVTEQFR